MSGLQRGFTVRLASDVRLRDGGRTLIGGAPSRISHLSPAARKLISDRSATVTNSTSATLVEYLLSAGMAVPVLDATPDFALGDVTCVIPIRGHCATLRTLLAGLAGAVRVIVVDDASDDSLAVRDVAAAYGATVIRLERNLGPAGARNAGLRRVRTPYVLFADCDAIIDPDAIRMLGRHFCDPGLAMVAPRIVAANVGSNWVSRYEAARSSLDLGPSSALVHPGTRVSWVPSACLLARTSALCGGFDGTLRVAEDVDLVWALIAEGWRVRYEAEVEAGHRHRTELHAWLTRKAFYGTGGALLAQRHGSKVAPAVFSPAGVAIAVSLLAQRRWSLPVALGLAAVTGTTLARGHQHRTGPSALAAELTARSIVSTVRQTMGLLLRHWWPLSVVTGALSPRIRRAVVASVIIDSCIEYRRADPEMGFLSFALLRRLDDLAYGTGLWAGSWHHRTAKALWPAVRRLHPNSQRNFPSKSR